MPLNIKAEKDPKKTRSRGKCLTQNKPKEHYCTVVMFPELLFVHFEHVGEQSIELFQEAAEEGNADSSTSPFYILLSQQNTR